MSRIGAPLMALLLAGCTSGASLDEDLGSLNAIRKWEETIARPWNALGECIYREYRTERSDLDIDYVEFTSSRSFELRSYIAGYASSKTYLAHIRGAEEVEGQTRLEVAASTDVFGEGWSQQVRSIIAACRP